MAQTMSSGDIGVAGFDTPAMLNLAMAGSNFKVVAVPINRIEPMFVVRSNIQVPGRFEGQERHHQPLRLRFRYHHPRRAALLEARSGEGRELFSDPVTRRRAWPRLMAGQMDAALVSSTGVAKIIATGCCRVLADLDRAAAGVCQLRCRCIRLAAEESARNGEAILAGHDRRHPCIQNQARDGARSTAREYQRCGGDRAALRSAVKSFRDFPTPEPRGIQNVIDALPMPKAKGATAEDFIDATLMEEIRKSGFVERLLGK